MAANEPISDSGTLSPAITVAGPLRRNTKIIATTRAMDSVSSNSTSSTEERMVMVRSVTAVMVTPAGSDDSSWPGAVLFRHLASPEQKVWGSSFLMLFTTPMTLAPGWRWMFRMIDGVRSCRAPSWLFSTPLTTVATSFRCTGAPFL